MRPVARDTAPLFRLLLLRGHGELAGVARPEEPDLDKHPRETPDHRGEGHGVAEAIVGLVTRAVL